MSWKYEFYLEDGSVEIHNTSEHIYIKDMFSRGIINLKKSSTSETYINMSKVLKVNIFEVQHVYTLSN